MTSRTWPILVFAFGSLVLLIALTGVGASRRARQIQNEFVAIHTLEGKTSRVFHEIQANIHLSGILSRDYLLDPSHLTAAAHRQELIEIRSSMAKQLEELDRLVGREEAKALGMLQVEIESYWRSMEPIFEWTPQQKLALSAIFLRQHVLPRRDAVLSVAEEIRALNRSNLERQQELLNRSRADFERYLWRMMAIVLSLGLVVAGASILRISRLERHAAEHQRRTEQAERELRRLSQQLVHAQEAERKSLSRELHDQVGQMLTALRMEAGNLEDARRAPDPQFTEKLREIKVLAEQALSAVRNLAMGIRPAMLDDLGLGPALEWQGREFSRRSGIPATVQIDGTLDGLPDSHRTCVFRVVQEALTNCARHSQAKNIRVAVHGREDGLSLIVQDDGVGFSDNNTSRHGLGLVGIEERARELGGIVTIHSQPGKGTSVMVELPLERKATLT